MTEFNPASERHFPVLIIKRVEPGCTSELQIEDCATGEIVRVTTTDNPAADELAMEAEVIRAWRKVWLSNFT